MACRLVERYHVSTLILNRKGPYIIRITEEDKYCRAVDFDICTEQAIPILAPRSTEAEVDGPYVFDIDRR